MTKKIAYTYTILRYVHDTTTGEFVNVAVALHAPESHFVRARGKVTRVSKVYPSAGTKENKLQSRVKAICDAFKVFEDTQKNQFEFSDDKTIMAIAHKILPHDDSSFQWSPPGVGLTENPQKTLEALFDRMVTRHELAPPKKLRNDKEIWKEFSRRLETRNSGISFVPKLVSTPNATYEFSHAVKNGVFHCIEPLSFDLANEENIIEKAQLKLGQMTSIKEDEDWKAYFLVGEPQDPHLREACEKGKKILAMAPHSPKVYSEGQEDALIQKIVGIAGHR